jgi:hypothetical protein
MCYLLRRMSSLLARSGNQMLAARGFGVEADIAIPRRDVGF